MFLLTACYGSDDPSAARDEAPELNRGTALVETDGSSALFYVTVAETEEQRTQAFEDATSLEADEGMAFLYFEPTGEPFVTEGQLALSVAFFDADGTVLDVADMQPCPPDDGTCPTHDPGVPYQGALIVDEGGLAGIGVDESTHVEIVPGSE